MFFEKFLKIFKKVWFCGGKPKQSRGVIKIVIIVKIDKIVSLNNQQTSYNRNILPKYPKFSNFLTTVFKTCATFLVKFNG